MKPLEPLNVRSRKQWEALLRDNLVAAENEYKAIRKEHAALMDTSASLGLLTPDGCAAVENAIGIQRYVLAKYERALREFSELIHFGRTPQESIPSSPEPDEFVGMKRLFCEHCSRDSLARMGVSENPEGVRGWTCAVCGAWIGALEPAHT